MYRYTRVPVPRDYFNSMLPVESEVESNDSRAKIYIAEEVCFSVLAVPVPVMVSKSL